ncbi:MAG: energy-coupling factor ABC transporter ATP-binding protein [Bryobacteraceae bacterium]|nr:energy-coupling factor ABC transporter ATP-binding protein [Bryobacteraceae bacterium]
MRGCPVAVNVFELERVSFSYRGVTALDDVSLTVPTGRRLALLGANGCGKSTLLRILAALYFPDSGSVRYHGAPLTEAEFEHDSFSHAFRKRVGLVFQNPDVQLFCPTVFDEVAFGPLQLGWPKERIRQTVNEALDYFEIADLRERAPHRLSGGEKKRVALASVLIMDPEVILLDEPTAALDPRSQSQIVALMKSWESLGKTLVIATHDLHLLTEIADDCLVLDKGRIAGRGTPAEILADESMLLRANLIRPAC